MATIGVLRIKAQFSFSHWDILGFYSLSYLPRVIQNSQNETLKAVMNFSQNLDGMSEINETSCKNVKIHFRFNSSHAFTMLMTSINSASATLSLLPADCNDLHLSVICVWISERHSGLECTKNLCYSIVLFVTDLMHSARTSCFLKFYGTRKI